MSKHLTYLELPSGDAARAAAFYQAVTGWTIERRPDGRVRFSDEAARLFGGWRAGAAAPIDHYQVDSVRDAVARGLELGGAVVDAPYLEGDTTVARLRDPDGRLFGIWELHAPVVRAHAKIGALALYHEIHGRGDGPPLVLLHGGAGSIEMFGPVLPRLAERRRVIAVDLQAHGRTADIDRPLRFEHMADDIAALIAQLGLGAVDVAGYSLGGSTAARLAIQHPSSVRKLALVSIPMRRDGWFPEVRAGMAQVGRASAEMAKGSPLYAVYSKVAPRPDDWPVLWEKLGELIRRDYDWGDELAKLTAPVLLVNADADSVAPAHTLEMFALLGGGLRDAGWDGAARPRSRLAILPGTTHYDIGSSLALADAIAGFLD